jgi:hypothetical protein
MTPVPDRIRAAQLRQRRKNAGLVMRSVWVPKDRADEIMDAVNEVVRLMLKGDE